jgi:hypothetical protein
MALLYFFPFDLVNLLPFLNFGKTIEALRLLDLFSILALPEDFGLEVAFEATPSTSISIIVTLEYVQAG